MKYIKKFNNSSEYEEYALGDMILPNISYCSDNHKVYYNPLPIHNGHEYVDLGLPSGTKWAKMNVGAKKETDYGLYFAWGETVGYTADLLNTGQKVFNLDDYKWTNDGGETYTKYNSTDNKMVLDPEDDAAHINMGGDWHMPTKEQCDELFNIEHVTNAWVTDYNGSGINGRLFTSVKNSNTIFIPAAGNYEEIFSGISESGEVWTSTLNDDLDDADHYYFDNNRTYYNISARCSGLSVRGVLDKPKKIINFTINNKSYQAEDGMTWEQWVNSKYNVVENPYTGSGSLNNGNWYIRNGNVNLTNDNANVISVKNIDGDFISSSDKIIENYAYIANSGDLEPT